jgi:hypothetical protein
MGKKALAVLSFQEALSDIANLIANGYWRIGTKAAWTSP